MTTRRTLLKAALATVAIPAGLGTAMAKTPLVRIHDGRPGLPIPATIYGSNELGRMDGGSPSIDFDRPLRTPFRRLGGNLTTGYNWVLNTANAGRDWHQANTFALADFLDLSPEVRLEPAAVIAAMHRNSLDVGAMSLVTLPLAGFVAADANGEVSEAETAPSARFVPVLWESDTAADAPVDRGRADIPQLLRKLVATFGGARSAKGIRAYALDNEPGLWAENHPRIVPQKPTIRSLIDRSITAARTIKTIDPDALVFGPASWGVTEFQSFQNAPDWSDFSHYGSFIAAYLDAFKQASDESGMRLLDVLDVHWYPQSRAGDLFRTENPDLASALLASPRTLTEPGFHEDSWVTEALSVSNEGGLSLPILPSFQRLIGQWFPGTLLGVTEFNFGGPGQITSGLAVADVLGRFGGAGVSYAAHWGNLEGALDEAYRLYRDFDGRGGQFPDNALRVENPALADLAIYAGADHSALHVIVINRSEAEKSVRVAVERDYRSISAYGFDMTQTICGAIGEGATPFDRKAQWVLPRRSARHFVLE